MKPVAEFELPEQLLEGFEPRRQIVARELELEAGRGLVIDELLSSAETSFLVELLDQAPWLAVGTNGILRDYLPGDKVGSWRASAFSNPLAELLFERIEDLLEPIDGLRPLGVNPLMRFIRYRPGGSLVAHYDAPYHFDSRRLTAASLVIYLSDGAEGPTRFIRDPEPDPEFADWPRPAGPSEVYLSVSPRAGRSLIFPHRILHDSEPLNTETKTIMRTDVIFEEPRNG